MKPISASWAEKTALQLLTDRPKSTPAFCTVSQSEPLSRAALLMLVHGFSRIPVTEKNEVVGMVDEGRVLRALGSSSASLDLPIGECMGGAPPVLDGTARGDEVWQQLVGKAGLVLIRHAGEWKGILTPSDLLSTISGTAASEFII